jgi:hypothetical protein
MGGRLQEAKVAKICHFCKETEWPMAIGHAFFWRNLTLHLMNAKLNCRCFIAAMVQWGWGFFSSFYFLLDSIIFFSEEIAMNTNIFFSLQICFR